MRDIQDNDVPLVKGKAFSHHPGTVKLESILRSYETLYADATGSVQKDKILSDILAEFESANLRLVHCTNAPFRVVNEERDVDAIKIRFRSRLVSHRYRTNNRATTAALHSHPATSAFRSPTVVPPSTCPSTTPTSGIESLYGGIGGLRVISPRITGPVIISPYSWSDADIKRKLVVLAQVLESKEVSKYLIQCANSKKNDSATYINEAIQLSMEEFAADKGHAKAYMGLQEFFDDPDDFLLPGEIERFIKGLIAQENLAEGLELTNMSILCGNGKRGPQPTHADTPLAEKPLETECFGIFMLSDESNGTISYRDIPAHPTAEDLKSLWHDAPNDLVDKLYQTGKSRDSLRKYSQLLFASKEKRVEPGIVPQHSMYILNGSHPHCAPAAEGPRAVLFFVLTPLNGEAAYDGKEQMSKEKLTMMLYDELLEALGSSFTGVERNYLVRKFVSAVVESLSYGADDNTLVLPTDWDWDDIRERLEASRAAKAKVLAAEATILADMVALEEAKAEAHHANEELELAVDMMGIGITMHDYRDS